MSMAMDSEIEEWKRERIEDRLDSSGYRTFLRIAGTLSVLGAGYIMQDIVKDAARRKATKNRIILLMSACDFLNQLFHSVIGPAMVPKGIGVPGAVGNQLTCDIQGFSCICNRCCIWIVQCLPGNMLFAHSTIQVHGRAIAKA